MAEARVESYRMWGEHVWSIMDCRDRRAARGIARSGGLAGGVDQRSDCLGVLRAARQRAPLAVDFWSGGGDWAGARTAPGPDPVKARAALSVIEAVLAPGVSERPNWTLPRLADEIEKRTGKRISKSRLSVVLKKGALPGVGHGTP